MKLTGLYPLLRKKLETDRKNRRFRKWGYSNLEDQDLVRNRSGTINYQECGRSGRDPEGIKNRRIGDFEFRRSGDVEIPSDTEMQVSTVDKVHLNHDNEKREFFARWEFWNILY